VNQLKILERKIGTEEEIGTKEDGKERIFQRRG
jgi:hypothetical protein